MSNPEHPFDGNEDAEFENICSQLHLGELDPQLTSLIADLEQIQTVLDEDEDDAAAIRQLRVFNDNYRTTGWLGSFATVTGRLYIAPHYNDGDLYDPYLKDVCRARGEDERGVYYEVVDVRVVASPATTNFEGDATPECGQKLVLSFTTPETKATTEDDGEPEFVQENTGEYYAYLDEEVLPHIQFDEPSVVQAALDLKYHYPEIYQYLLDTIAPRNASKSAVLASLQKFVLPLDAPLSPVERSQLAQVIAERTGLDDVTLYRFVLTGEYQAITRYEGIRSFEAQAGMSMYAEVSAVDFIERDDGYHLMLIVAELGPVGKDYRGYCVPVESITKFQDIRPRNERMGNIAMVQFEAPEELAEWWYEGSNKPHIPETASQNFVEQNNTIDDDIARNLLDSALGDVIIDPEHDACIIPVDGAIHRLVDAYIDHVTAFTESDITPEIYNQIEAFLNQTDIPKLGDFEPLEWLSTDGACTIIDEFTDDEGDACVGITEIPAGESVLGQFAGVVVRDVMPLDPDTPQDYELMTSLCIALTNCRIISAHDEVDEPFSGEVQFIPITIPQTPRFARYLPIEREDNND